MSAPDRDTIDFRGERGRHERFVGREDVLAALDERLVGPGAARGWVLVTGQPGMGKSALLTRWLELAEQAGRPAPHHFVRRGVADWDRPEAISRSLAAQIERLYPGQADPEARPESRLLDLIGRVSREVLVPRGERLCLVADGLDEAAAAPGQNPLPLFLPYALPPGVMVLCGSRPTYPHLSWLEGRDGFLRRFDLDGPEWAGSNEAVCRALWEGWAPAFAPPLAPGFVEEALAAGAGNVLYAVKLREWLSTQPVGERRVSRLPRGLRGLLEQAWADLRRLPKEAREAAISGLGVMCAAREALPREAIEAAAGWESGEAWEEFLGAVRPFVLEEPEHWAGEAAYRPYHESFRELVAEKVGAKGMREHHRRLLATVAAWPAAEGDESARRYATKHAVGHAIAAGEREKAGELCRDVGFLEGWCREGGVEALEDGLREAGEALGEEVRLLRKVVRAESHWLREDPGAMGELVYNRLRSVGWDASQIRARLRWGDRLPAYRLRHPVRMGWGRTLVGHTGKVTACAVSPDGRRIVSASEDCTLQVWDAASGRLLATLEGHSAAVRGCALTPDGREIVSASEDRTLRVWDVETGRVRLTLEGHIDSVTACAVTPDGRRVLSASWDGTPRVWDLASGREVITFPKHRGRDWACAITPDGEHAVCASDDGLVRLWKLGTGAQVLTVRALTYWVGVCVTPPECGRLVHAGPAASLAVWDLAPAVAAVEKDPAWQPALIGEPGEPIRLKEGTVWSLGTVTPDGRRLVHARDKTLTVWDLPGRRALATLADNDIVISACAVAPDGRRAVAGDYRGRLKVWDLEGHEAPPDHEGHAMAVGTCATTPDGRRVVSASDDGTVKVWDAWSGRVLASLAGQRPCYDVWLLEDGHRVVSMGDGGPKWWDVETGREARELLAHLRILAAAERAVLVSDGRFPGTLEVRDAVGGAPLGSLQAGTAGIGAGAVTPDGRRAAVVLSDGMVCVWDLASGAWIRLLDGELGSGTGLAIAPDGARVVCTSREGILRVIEVSRAGRGTTLALAVEDICRCAVTPDGRHVVASLGNTLKVWDISTCEHLATIHGVGLFLCVAAGSDILCAGDAAGNVWILDTPWGCSQPSLPAATPLRLFYSYASADAPLLAALDNHLANLERQGLIALWHAGLVSAGGDALREASAHLDEADVILLLVSADFIASDYCYEEELTRALARHREGTARVLPILVRAVDRAGAPFADLPVLPGNAKPVTQWPDQDAAWTDVVEGIRHAIEEIHARRR